ncbi:MAG TPA: phosphoribosylformylglycinamidine synthase [Clostridia bacterium]|nr:phosphoribosylformylglycinamidine synthase [Clostridia bacterium]
MSQVVRIFAEKKPGFDAPAQLLQQELQEYLGIKGLKGVRLIHRYDMILPEEHRDQVLAALFPETMADKIYVETLPLEPTDHILIKEPLLGQFHPKEAAAAQAIMLLTGQPDSVARTGEILVLSGELSPAELDRIKSYWLNPLAAREGHWEKPASLQAAPAAPPKIAVLEGFTRKREDELASLGRELGLAMSLADLQFCQAYFRDQEQRDPTVTEIRILDTYWSDHCRHKTFNTPIAAVEIAGGPLAEPIKAAHEAYLAARESLGLAGQKAPCLMDLATISMKELRRLGALPDLEESEETNAASIKIAVEHKGKREDWLLMFKNETHNHPTEIEPFAGAATCLGGAIRDPMSGRSYVYQAMRVTGSGDPRTPIEETLPGKLPQRYLTKTAALGYSSYGNQVGVPAGQVVEIYHEGYRAKRMELGALIAAAPAHWVHREKPQPGDVILLVGNKTGRDGCGGATGSSKELGHSPQQPGAAEVPAGNPLEERKLIRLFRNPAATSLIKKCNDFGAGGISVAIGELADGLVIDLDQVPLAYGGLDGTEIATAETQERMAVVIAPENVPAFLQLAEGEGLAATPIAGVTPDRRLKIYWQGDLIVDLDRDFLNSGGIKEEVQVRITAPAGENNYFSPPGPPVQGDDLKKAWLAHLQQLNNAGQRSLAQLFDATAGGHAVLAPYGGKYQSTPQEGMVSQVPVPDGETTTGTIMTFGFNPELTQWSPFHGGLYAVVEAVAKNVALGGDYTTIRLSLQEYFEKLGRQPEKWGKPFAALLGAYWAQKQLLLPSIGGKDSMSGTWHDLDVPPTLVAFAVNTVNVTRAVSAEFKKPNSLIVLIPAPKDENGIPDFEQLKANFRQIHALIQAGYVLAAGTVKTGGLAVALSKMAFGNRLGFVLEEPLSPEELFAPDYGTIVLEMPGDLAPEEILAGVPFRRLGRTQAEETIVVNGVAITLQEAYTAWHRPLAGIFGGVLQQNEPLPPPGDQGGATHRKTRKASIPLARPRVLIAVFPGTNGEYETGRAFTRAGGAVETLVLTNRTLDGLAASLNRFSEALSAAQILVLPGGAANWDEPEGSGKYIELILRHPRVQESILAFLDRDGLILGLGNGFQALLRTGLLPYGRFRPLHPRAPLLAVNRTGQHEAQYVKTKVVSTLSPWLALTEVGEAYVVPVSCREGRFIAPPEEAAALFRQGQVATQYVDEQGQPALDYEDNPTGAWYAVEGITSPDGRILGKMSHPERWGPYTAINIPGTREMPLFKAGIAYFR